MAIYVNSTTIWLKQLSSNKKVNRDKVKFRMDYRGHQVMGNIGFTLCGTLVAAYYLMGVLIIVSLLFCVIRFRTVFHPLISIWMAGVVVIAISGIFFLVLQAIKIRVESEAALSSFQRNPLNRTKLDLLFLKSCRPIKVKVGSFGCIEYREFLLIMFKLIQDALVSLLLAT